MYQPMSGLLKRQKMLRWTNSTVLITISLHEAQTTLDAIGSTHRSVLRYSKSIRRDFLKSSKLSKNLEAEIAEMDQQSTNLKIFVALRTWKQWTEWEKSFSGLKVCRLALFLTWKWDLIHLIQRLSRVWTPTANKFKKTITTLNSRSRKPSLWSPGNSSVKGSLTGRLHSAQGHLKTSK